MSIDFSKKIVLFFKNVTFGQDGDRMEMGQCDLMSAIFYLLNPTIFFMFLKEFSIKPNQKINYVHLFVGIMNTLCQTLQFAIGFVGIKRLATHDSEA